MKRQHGYPPIPIEHGLLAGGTTITRLNMTGTGVLSITYRGIGQSRTLNMGGDGTFEMIGVLEQYGSLVMGATTPIFFMTGDLAPDAAQLHIAGDGVFSMDGTLNQTRALNIADADGTFFADGTLNQTRTLNISGDGTYSSVVNAPDALLSGEWTVSTGTGSGELDFAIVTPPDSDAPIVRYDYSTDAGSTWATLVTGGTTATISTLSAGGSITDGQSFVSQLQVRAVSFTAGSGSDLKSATAGSTGSYDPADTADFYFEVGRSVMWEELTGQTTVTTNGNIAGELENIGVNTANAFAHASGTRGTYNSSTGLLELTDGTDSYNYNPGAVPSGCTIAWVGDLDEASDNFPDRIISVAEAGQPDVDNNGTFSIEHTFTAGQYHVVENYTELGTAFSPTTGWGALPFIVTWEFGAGGAFEVYSNNSLLDSGTHTNAISGAVSDLDIGILSANAGSGGYVPIDLKAFAYFDTVLSASDRGDLNTYLAAL